MRKVRVLFLVALMAVSSLASGQEGSKAGDKNSNLEKLLWDAEQQWLCNFSAGPYQKTSPDCVKFRRSYWPEQFFEISFKGKVRTKTELLADEATANYIPSPPYPDQFKLMAVYGNVALATDHTALKTVDANGKRVTTDTRVLRLFVKENGKWRPAAAAQVPIVSQ